MANIVVADKQSTQITQNAWGDISLQGPSLVQMPVSPNQVATVTRNGQDLVVTLRSGEKVTVGNFFAVNPEGVASDMVFVGEDGTLWHAVYDADAFTGFTFESIASLDELMADLGVVGSATPTFAIAGLSLLGIGGAAAASGGGGGGGGGGDGTPGDTTAPASPTDLLVSADGLRLSGLGEAGATVFVRDNAGNVIGTGTVGADGSFEVTLGTPQVNGEQLGVTLGDAAGNTSEAAAVTAPDLGVAPGDTTPPGVPTDLALTDGTTVTGAGEPGATIEVRDATGAIVGTGVVGDDGRFSLAITPALANGEPLDVRQVDAAGNSSPPVVLIAPDTTPPAALSNVVVAADGTSISGRGEPGARVEVRDADGNLIGTGTVSDNGSFVLPLDTPVTVGQNISLVQIDAGNNPSESLQFTVPVTPAPAAPADVVLAGDGSSISGTAPVGSQVEVRDNTGAVIGSVVVGADGGFTIGLTPPLTNGERVDVVVVDGNGASSLPVQITAPDTTAPAAPSELAVSANGEQLTGRGEPGSTVRVVDADGNELGTAVVNDAGSFSITLDPPQVDGQQLQVSASDAAGNTSVAVGVDAPGVGNPGGDTTPPEAASDVLVSADGRTVSGRGEAGASVQVRDAAGTVIATGTVAEDGTFSLALDPAVLDGSTLQVGLTDAAGNASPDTPVTSPDLTAPATPADLTLAGGTTLTGGGEPGATVEVRDASGAIVGTGVVGDDGRFSLAISPALTNGEPLDVRQVDAAGNSSTPLVINAPDTTPPAILSDVVVGADGVAVSGRGEPGNRVEVRDADGNLIGTGAVAANGSFVLSLDTLVAAGQSINLTQFDAADNPSENVQFTVPVTPAPAAPADVVLAGDGSSISGTAPVGSQVEVRDNTGAVIGSVVVGADGGFTIGLTPPLTNGELIDVVVVDGNGASSLPVQITAPDTTAPAAPSELAVSANGEQLTGRGEPGSTVRVVDADGNELGTAVVNDAGSFSITLDPPQVDGQVLQVSAFDATGNTSAAVGIGAPDIDNPGADTTPPDAPTDLTISTDGRTLSGRGEAGATVNVLDAQGAAIATGTVLEDGSFNLQLDPPVTDGSALQVTLTDVAGNVSTGAPLVAPDSAAPAQPTDLLLADGVTLTGTAEAGARLEVRDASGTLIGAIVVGPDGTFSVALAPAQNNAEILDLRVIDAAGNTSTPLAFTAPDGTAPDLLSTVVIGADGLGVSGRGEPGATVEVRNATGDLIGSGTVGANGTFLFDLDTAVVAGDTISLVQVDAAGNGSDSLAVIVPADPVPASPAGLVLAADGSSVSGSAPVGSLVEVTDAQGALLGSVMAGGDGTFTVDLTPAQANGEIIDVVAIDADGNNSLPTQATAPDITAPNAATDLILNPDGLTLIGRGEAGATVQVTNDQGAVVGTGVVGDNGVFSIALAPAQTNGQVLDVILNDGAGNASAGASITAPDLDGPLQPSGFAIDIGGTVLTGAGQAGSTVTVRSADGTLLGTTTVAADNRFTVTLAEPQRNGETLLAEATDSRGNSAGPVSYTVPDGQAPEPITEQAIDGRGALVSGFGEAGATVIVRGPDGAELGRGLVNPDGSFQVTLTTAQTNAQALTVEQQDVAGNVSTPVDVTAPDTEIPLAPVIVQLSTDGAVLTGTGEAGATVTVTGTAGAVLGTTVVEANGSFSVTLLPPQLNGQTLSATQADAVGNQSPAATLVATDLEAPLAPSGTGLDAAGAVLSGQGEAGTTVEVRNAAGALVGDGVVLADGSFSVTLDTPQTNGEILSVELVDGAGYRSPAISVTAADTTAADAPTGLAINADGSLVTGTGQPGATVQVLDAAGTVLNTSVVLPDGSFAVPLAPAQQDGQALSVNQIDGSGVASVTTPVSAPDIAPPTTPAGLTVSSDGTTLTGTSPGATNVSVRDAAGNELVSVPTDADGSFNVTLPVPLTNGEQLTVVTTDAVGNASDIGAVTAPDTTFPDAAGNLTLSPGGDVIAGTAEPGATVIIRNGGTDITNVQAGPDGTFRVEVTPALVAGDVVQVVVRDAAGNETPVDLAGPDGPEVATPTALTLSADGFLLTGEGAVGSLITVTSAGTTLGTATVGNDGVFRVFFLNAQLNAQTLQVDARFTAGGKPSVPATVVAEDTTAPEPLANVAIDRSGSLLTGSGEVGATVTVAGPGDFTASAVVGTDGLFSITMVPPQANFQALTVIQTDAAGNVSLATPVIAPDLQAPVIPAGIVLNAAATVVSGQGEIGATVTVRDAGGALLGTGTVNQSGTFQVTLPSAQTAGTPLQVTLTDAAGNISAPASLATPDRTPPAAVDQVLLSGDGRQLTGLGEVGATVQVRNAAGTVVGSATVGADGRFSVLFVTPQNAGQALGVTQVDAQANTSPATLVTTPDLTAPAPLSNVVLNNNGLTLTGLGEAGATVTVAGPDGTIVGTGLVAANGSFTLTLDTAQLNAEQLSVTQTDAGNNVSAPLPVTAPDLTPPAAPVALVLASTGVQLVGSAEAGSTVTVRDASGTVLGSALVAANGTFQVSLSSAQVNGEALQVTATDAAGNVSLAASFNAADTTPPAAVSNLAVSADGATLAGYGEAGASVVVSAADGTPLGTATVASDGHFTVALAPAAATGDLLSVVQTDAGLNVSPASTVAAPGALAPEVPANLAVTADGLSVTGTGTPGSTVNVYGPSGVLLGTAIVDAPGTFTANLAAPQANGEILQVGAVGTDGSASLQAELIAPDITAPQPLTQLALSNDGLVLIGRGEPGATVSVLGEGGLDLGTSLVNADGSFAVTLSAAQINGEALSASQSDVTGNESNSVSLTATDRVAPDAPVALALAGGGTLLNGTGEVGALVSVLAVDGSSLGSGTVREDGTFQVTLTPAQANGETLHVLLTDGAGNQSDAGVVTALDTTAPALLAELAVSGDGVTLTGRGEAGAEVTVLDAAGAEVGTALVDASGHFTIVLDPPLGDAQVLRLTQTDLAGNVSPDASLSTPDFTPPAVLTNVVINADGSVVSGNGEVGATVTVSNPAGAVVGSSIVLSDGTFRVELDPPQINLEPLSVQQADPPGNVSDPVEVVAPDLTAPAAPADLRLNVDGTQLGGTGEIGTSVVVTTFAGVQIGTGTVSPDGTFLVDLDDPQLNGEQLLVSLVDISGNVSPEAPVTAVDSTVPLLTATLNADGTQLNGTSEAGARLTVINNSGDLVGQGVVDPDGTFVLTLITPQQNGQVLTVIAQDATGNPSVPVTLPAPDIIAPELPAGLALAGDGIVFTGTGEPGSIIQVRDPDGVMVGEGTVGDDRSFSFNLVPAQANGETLTVIAVDAAGNESLPQTVLALDTTPPEAVTNLAIDTGYASLVGRGQPGATVTVTQGTTVLGEAMVEENGTFVVPLDPGATPGGDLDVVQTDTAGTSPVTLFDTPLEPVPAAPANVQLAADGITVTGSAAEGTAIEINDADGNLIIAGEAGPGDTFTILLPTAQLNGELLNVVAVSTGGESQPFVLQADDITPPAAPVVTALSANGLVLTGTGEAGATVSVTASNGNSLGTAVVNVGGVFSVNLASAQLNGQVLAVSQADAADNPSGITRFTATDVQAPSAPANLLLDTAGVTLTGTGEPGATITVTGAGATPITGIVGVDGNFSITLPAQVDGQLLTVRQSDAAGNTSGSTSITAADLTPPLAPVATINSAGTAVSGTGQAGATVTVTNAITGAVVGSAIVGSTGAFTVTLPTAQVDFQSLIVTQADRGGASPGTPLTAPDFTPPAAAGNLAVNPEGTLLTGTGEAGATVTVRLPDGTLLPTTTVQPDGSFQVTLSPVQDNGQVLSVTLADPRGNTSGNITVTAPDVDADRPVIASDNLATATVELAAVSGSQVFTDSFTTLLSGFQKTFTWTVDANTTADPILTLTTSSALALLDNALFTLQVKDASGAWVTLASGTSPGLLDLILLPLGQGIQADLGTLRAGDYRLTVASSGIGLLTTVTTALDVTTTSLTQFTGTGTPLNGNVLTDPGVDGTLDVTGPDSAAVVQVSQFGSYVNAGAGVTVQGLYGSLLLRGDGSYTYTPNGSASSIGKVDVFSYQLAHPNGLTDAATLYVRIDSPQAAETWSDPNLAAPAVVVDAVDDVDSSDISLAAREDTSTQSFAPLILPVIGVREATYATEVAADTSADLQVVLTSTNLLGLLNGSSIELLKLNPATGQYVSVQTVSGGSLVSLLGGGAAYTFEDQGPGAYHVRVRAGGIGLASSITTTVNATTTFNNELVVGNYSPVIGNLLTNTSGGSADYQGSALTVLSVLVAANTFVNPGQNGVSVVGNYGTLHVQADGTYTYLLKTGLTSAVIGQSDTFTYELTHPNGTSDTATLTINLNNAANATTTSAFLGDAGDDSGLVLASVTGETIAGTDSDDRLDGSQGGAVTLQGGAGDDTLVIVDQDFASVDGGSGTDTLLWAGGDAGIDLGNLLGRLHDIDVIDLNDTSAVSLSLDLADVIAVTDSASDTLVIKGGSEDSLTFRDNWTQLGNETADGIDYIQYVAQEDPSHHLWVQNSINVV